jgi:hypothetical protein
MLRAPEDQLVVSGRAEGGGAGREDLDEPPALTGVLVCDVLACLAFAVPDPNSADARCSPRRTNLYSYPSIAVAITAIGSSVVVSGLPGEPHGVAEADAWAAAEEPLCVDASGEPDEGVDRGEYERDRERVFPQWDADQDAAGGEHERGGEREDRE